MVSMVTRRVVLAFPRGEGVARGVRGAPATARRLPPVPRAPGDPAPLPPARAPGPRGGSRPARRRARSRRRGLARVRSGAGRCAVVLRTDRASRAPAPADACASPRTSAFGVATGEHRSPGHDRCHASSGFIQRMRTETASPTRSITAPLQPFRVASDPVAHHPVPDLGSRPTSIRWGRI